MTNIISLGMGVQSTALYFQSSMGEIPRADLAIFVDPGKEKTQTLEYHHFLEDWRSKNNGIPIKVVSKKNLFVDLLNKDENKRFASIPCFTKDPENGKVGMLRRQCTNEYKIMQVDKAISEYYGLKKYARRPKTAVWLGITVDEVDRISYPKSAWKINVFPYLNYHTSSNNVSKSVKYFDNYVNRNDLYAWYKNNNLPIPIKSGCVFCPFQSDFNWYDLKENYPEDFEAAIEVDIAIRNDPKSKGRERFLHKSCVPLNQVKFNQEDQTSLGDCFGHCQI